MTVIDIVYCPSQDLVLDKALQKKVGEWTSKLVAPEQQSPPTELSHALPLQIHSKL